MLFGDDVWDLKTWRLGEQEPFTENWLVQSYFYLDSSSDTLLDAEWVKSLLWGDEERREGLLF